MGEVDRARDTKLNRDVAIKVLPTAFAQDHERVARFKREAQVLASLNHPNITAVYGREDEGDAASNPSNDISRSPTMSRHLTDAGMILGAAAYRVPSVRAALQGDASRTLEPLGEAAEARVWFSGFAASSGSENTKAAIMRVFWVMRRAALEIGRFVTDDGVKDPGDVFFLELAELTAREPLDLRHLVVPRRTQYEAFRREDPPRVVDAPGACLPWLRRRAQP